jgi:hypothetical protein
MEFYDSRTALWFHRTSSFAVRSWMRLIALGTLSIQEPIRCFKTWRRVFGRQEWREKSWSKCRNVTYVKESRPIIWDQPKIYSPWASPSGNGKTYTCTSLWVYPHTSREYNSIWIIVDRLTKSAHFIPISATYRVWKYSELYMSHIIRYHGILKTIISDWGSISVAHFLE